MASVFLKGVVFDVDGTLLTSANTVSRRMQEVCRALGEKGIWLTIASARPPTSVLRIADEIGASGPHCALNGAVVLARDGSMLTRLCLPREIMAGLVARREGDSSRPLQGVPDGRSGGST